MKDQCGENGERKCELKVEDGEKGRLSEKIAKVVRGGVVV